MKFNELVEKVGIGLAVVIAYNKLSEDFFDKLSFEQWLSVYENAPAGSALKETALVKMAETAQTFEQWLAVYENAPIGSELKKTALAKMGELIEV